MAAFRINATPGNARRSYFLHTAVTALALILGMTNAHAQSDDTAAEDKTTMATHSLPEGVSAMVNDEPIYTESLNVVLKQFQAGNQAVDESRVLDEIISMQVLTLQAEKIELDKDPEVAAALRLQYVQTLANAYLANISKDIEHTEEELRAMYDEQIASIEDDEFRASHILLETKEDADKVLELLGEGREFTELAAEHSVDPGGNSGGDLGWFRNGDMVSEFYYAAKAMEVGSISEAPVKSEFGYHIIQLNDKRGGQAPDYESVKENLAALATRNKMNEIMEKLINEADVVR